MRMLYIGQCYKGTTSFDRLGVIRALGVECEEFNVAPFDSAGWRVSRSLAHRFNVGSPVRAFNEALCARADARDGRPITHVWMDKGKWLYPATLRKMVERWGAKMVHYTPDAAFMSNRSRWFRRSVPLYDVMFTTKPFEMDLYKQAGARRVYLTYQAYESTRFRPMESEPRFESDIAFVGHWERPYAEWVRVATRTGAKVKVWGPGWPEYARRAPWARNVVQGSGLWGEDYPKGLASAKIGLGLLSKLIPETTTTRSFEIPATGVFMLAERTREHGEMFEEGKEAEFFDTAEELIKKARYYLDHPEERQRIAAAGRARCERDGYSNHDRLQWMLDRVREIG